MATTHNLTLYQGDTWTTSVTFEKPDGSPYPLDGFEFQAQIRTGSADASPLAAEMTVIVTDNVVALSLEPAQTAELPASGRWDLQSTDGSRRVTWLAGTVKVTPEVTRT
jgi:hypothetical protein